MRHHKINNDIDPQWQSMMNRHRSEFCWSASWSPDVHMTPWRHISAIVPVCVYVSRTIFFCAKLSHDFDSGLIRRWVCLFWLLLSRISILQNNVLFCVNNVGAVGIRLWQRLYSVTYAWRPSGVTWTAPHLASGDNLSAPSLIRCVVDRFCVTGSQC